MTDTETVRYLRDWANGGGNHGVWSWPTDTCGYDQHIRFVRYRNEYWKGEGTFEDFVRGYADKLDTGTL